MSIKEYNLRVYGLLMYDNQVLVTYENRGGVLMTKFPGGGLDKGEGIADCLIREFQEELEIEITIKQFYYVNDFLQISAFNASDQLISFYYIVETASLNQIPIDQFNENLPKGGQLFNWVSLDKLNPEDFTFLIDRIVAEKLVS